MSVTCVTHKLVFTHTLLQTNADFFYVDMWSSTYTWGGKDPPVEGDFVIIKAGQTILLDVENTPVFKMLLIDGK